MTAKSSGRSSQLTQERSSQAHTEDRRQAGHTRTPGSRTVATFSTNTGPRLLLPQIADAWYRYTDLGHPALDRFGLTAHDNGDQHIWLDHDHQAAGR